MNIHVENLVESSAFLIRIKSNDFSGAEVYNLRNGMRGAFNKI